MLAISRQRLEAAATLLGAADSDYHYNRLVYPPPQRQMIDQAFATVRAALGDPCMGAAWEVGKTMLLPQALEYALKTVIDLPG